MSDPRISWTSIFSKWKHMSPRLIRVVMVLAFSLYLSFWKSTHTKMFLIEHRPSSPFPRKKHILKTKLEMIISEYIKIFSWNKLFSQWHYFTFEFLIFSHKLVNIYYRWTNADTTGTPLFSDSSFSYNRIDPFLHSDITYLIHSLGKRLNLLLLLLLSQHFPSL